VSLMDNVLTVKGERKADHDTAGKDYFVREVAYGAFQRDFALPEGVDAAQVEAKYAKGMLEVRVPAPQAATARMITVKARLIEARDRGRAGVDRHAPRPPLLTTARRAPRHPPRAAPRRSTRPHPRAFSHQARLKSMALDSALLDVNRPAEATLLPVAFNLLALSILLFGSWWRLFAQVEASWQLRPESST